LLLAAQDVLHSLGGWASRRYTRNVATAIAGTAVAPDDLIDASANLTGERQAQLTCCNSCVCMWYGSLLSYQFNSDSCCSDRMMFFTKASHSG
jgi:hypothetical protein